VAICLSAGFFFAELVIGPMWSIPMDIAPKFSGTAAGLMNSGSALAAIVSPLVAGYVIDVTDNWYLPFIGSTGLLLLGASPLSSCIRSGRSKNPTLARSSRPRQFQLLNARIHWYVVSWSRTRRPS